MSLQPTVSVCIPVRDGSTQLPHTLSNLLLHSDYPADLLEVVVADHGSSDATPVILADYRARSSQLRCFAVPFTGSNRAEVRNRLIAAARGELLVFIDHDILTCREFVSSHVAAHQSFPGSLVAGEILGTTSASPRPPELDLDLDNISASADLVRRDAYRDPRVASASIGDAGVSDLSAQPAPFRWFWGGNLSAKREDIETSGRFDTRYEGWGIEDDDFAQQFRVAGRKLVFSRAAWSFHVSSPTDGWSKLAQWRRNFERFARKFPTREVEAYGLYGPELMTAGLASLENTLRILKQVELREIVTRASGRLGPVAGRRACFLVPDKTHADALALTDVLCPYQPLTTGPRQDGGQTWWSLVGLATPFETRSLDEIVLLVDALMWLERSLLTLLLCEAARVARSAVFVVSATARTGASALCFAVLRDVAGTLRFEQQTWLAV